MTNNYKTRNLGNLIKQHQTPDEAISALVRTLDIQEGDVVLDLMCGIGQFTRILVEDAKKRRINFYPIAQDISARNIAVASQIPRVVGSVGDATLDISPIDVNAVVIKMGLHEVSKEKQYQTLRNVYQALTNGGRIGILDMAPSDEEAQELQTLILRKKDALAGLDDLVINRYWSRKDELMEMLEKIRFKEITTRYRGRQEYNTKNWLQTDLQGSAEKLEEWNEFIRAIFSGNACLKEKYRFKELGETLQFSIPELTVIGARK